MGVAEWQQSEDASGKRVNSEGIRFAFPFYFYLHHPPITLGSVLSLELKTFYE
jgi:hypothetical protein